MQRIYKENTIYIFLFSKKKKKNKKINGLDEDPHACRSAICGNRISCSTFAAKLEIMNNENLIPNSERTPEELKEMTRRGGIASGAARRRKKSMREWAEVLGEVAMHLKTPDGADVPDGNAAAAVVLKQYQKAINKSDTNAAAFLMRLRGEDVQKIEQVDDEVKTAAIREQLAAIYGIEN